MFRFYNTRVGAVAHSPKDRCICLSLERYGEWAHLELSLLRLLVQRGATIFDVGANVGYHALCLSRFVGPIGRVVAFEANPVAARLANVTFAVNAATNVTLHQALVGDHTGATTIERIDDPTNLGAVRFRPPATPPLGEVTVAAQVRLDDFAIFSPELIKIDVEGMQDLVLSGATRLVETTRPILFIEANSDRETAEVRNRLAPLGYATFDLTIPAYNRENLLKDEVDVFGASTERATLAIPQSKIAEISNRHPFLERILSGQPIDWYEYPAITTWGGLRSWQDVHALNVALDPLGRPLREASLGGGPRIFVHIPKTAGTSVIDTIKPLFGADVRDISPADPFVIDRYGLDSAGYSKDGFYHGHLQLTDQLIAVPGASFFTVLRDPVDRALSEFIHAIDRNLNTGFGDTLSGWPFDFGETTGFDLAEYMLDHHNRLFFTNTHLRYLGALGKRTVRPGDVGSVIRRLEGVPIVVAALPTLQRDLEGWLGRTERLVPKSSNSRGRLRAADLFCQESLDRLYAANAEDLDLLRRLRPDAFRNSPISTVPHKQEELRRLAEIFARYRPKTGWRR